MGLPGMPSVSPSNQGPGEGAVGGYWVVRCGEGGCGQQQPCGGVVASGVTSQVAVDHFSFSMDMHLLDDDEVRHAP